MTTETDPVEAAPAPVPVTIFLHYDSTTGEIDGWDSHTPDPRPGMLVLETPLTGILPGPDTHKVDLTTKALVAMTDAEKALARVPTLSVVKARIRTALAVSDSFMLADRPVADADRAAWKTYRQALRDLSKLPSPSAMVAGWPLRPDGADAIGDLRK